MTTKMKTLTALKTLLLLVTLLVPSSLMAVQTSAQNSASFDQGSLSDEDYINQELEVFR